MIDSEDNRLREFRQLKKVIRGSKDHLIVGIDIAKEKHHAFFGTPTGKALFKRWGKPARRHCDGEPLSVKST